MKNYYKTLGLKEGASQEEIQSGKEKRAKLIDMINDQIVNPTYKSNQAP